MLLAHSRKSELRACPGVLCRACHVPYLPRPCNVRWRLICMKGQGLQKTFLLKRQEPRLAIQLRSRILLCAKPPATNFAIRLRVSKRTAAVTGSKRCWRPMHSKLRATVKTRQCIKSRASNSDKRADFITIRRPTNELRESPRQNIENCIIHWRKTMEQQKGETKARPSREGTVTRTSPSICALGKLGTAYKATRSLTSTVL